MLDIFLPLALGMVTGLLLGLTGAGGGLVAAPLLVLVMQVPVAQAAPVSLIAVLLSAGTGAVLGLRAGIVRYKAATVMAAAGLLLFPLGHLVAGWVPNRLLMVVFAALLLYQAWRFWGNRHAVVDAAPPCEINPTSGRFIWNRPCARALLQAGSFAGFLSGLLGVGGGFILVPALRRHTPLEMNAITATVLLVLALVSCGGLLQWSVSGHLAAHLAWPFAAGALVGMVAGREFASGIDEHGLQKAFALLCALIALGLAAKGLLGF